MADEDTLNKALLAPYVHISSVAGKGFRGKMIDSFNGWMKIEDHKTDGIKSIINKLHDSSLLIDDIEDDSLLRRGVPVAHKIYGVPATINSANYVYFTALQEAINLVPAGEDALSRKVLTAFTEELCALHVGQGKDIYFRDTNIVPTEKQYYEMVTDKTGGLFRLTVRIMQCFSSCDANFTALLNKMGSYFQILDDYLNLASERYHKSKTFCEDISEGKYSFVILHSIHKAAESGDDRLHRIVKSCSDCDEIKEYALTLMSETGSFEYTLQVLRKLYSDMTGEITQLGGNNLLQQLLDKLHSQTKPDSKEERDTKFSFN